MIKMRDKIRNRIFLKLSPSLRQYQINYARFSLFSLLTISTVVGTPLFFKTVFFPKNAVMVEKEKRGGGENSPLEGTFSGLSSPALFVEVASKEEPSSLKPFVSAVSAPSEEIKTLEGKDQWGSASSLSIQKIKIRKKDSLKEILARSGVPRSALPSASQALLKVCAQKELTPGLELTLKKYKGNFKELSFYPDFGEEIRLTSSDGDKFSAQKLNLKILKKMECMSGKVRSSLYGDAIKAGIPTPVVKQMIKTLSHAVDFDDLKRGDVFEVMFQRLQDSSDRHKLGDVTYVAVTVGGEPVRMYMFKNSKGEVSYYHEDGTCVRKGFLRTPVDSAVLSSKFGPRLHPILKYTRFHAGVDFRAAPGTRVMSAADGVVIHSGWKGSYGNCVIVRHNNEYTTLYAHLQKIVHKARRGARVRQGDVIGYVGSTGLCSGPHLHHEVLRFGKPINPAKVHHMSGGRLSGKSLRRLKSHVRSVDLQFAARPTGSLVASLQKSRLG